MQRALLLICLLAHRSLPSAALDIVWNAQWPELCPGPAPPPDIITRFGVKVNANSSFNGDVVSTLYNHPGSYTIGDWPSIFPNGTTINGGIPQLVNMSRHLDAVRKDIERHFPDPDFAGLAVIDWEVWEPWFEFYPDPEPLRAGLRI